MNPVDIIVKKRDGAVLTAAEIRYFLAGYVNGEIPDYQAAALAMAILFQGMTPAETTELTLAMAASGQQLDLHEILGTETIIVDKHSSGGVGDKTTLAVGPIVAACGLPVGKMSGRGLSFTGGTLDKLESIAGWSAELSEEHFRHQLREIGLVIAGQTAELAPADKLLYDLRDVTGTVPSLPLIASSIMSKKLAAGADAVVLDVKCGHGAFMETLDEARTLADLMVDIGVRAGRRVSALITQMEQPLGLAVGNALEVKEAIATLHGKGPADFTALVEIVAGEMIRLGSPGHTPPDPTQVRDDVRQAIAGGAALDRMRAFVAAQGGDVRMIDDPDLLPQAPVLLPVPAEGTGYVNRIAAREIGLVALELGGGRTRKGDPIDHRVGLQLAAKIGDRVDPGQTLCTVHAADRAAAQQAVDRVQRAFGLSPEAVAAPPVLLARISSLDDA